MSMHVGAITHGAQHREMHMIRTQQHRFSRRGFCLCCMSASAVGAAGGWLTPRQAFAQALGIVETIQAAAAKAPITVHRMRGNIAVLEGSGGNVAVLTGRDGKVMIDAGIAVSRPQMAAALASLGAEPVTYLINTHWHFDHAGGNAWIHEAGGSILAHENTLKHLSRDTRVEGNFRYTFPAASAGAIPSVIFEEEHTLRANDTTLMLKHYQPAHTDSDISVHFVEADILHTGDTFWNRDYPFIDYWTGGSIDGQIRAAEVNIAKVTDKTIVIPGHGAVGGKADLILFRDVLVEIRDRVAALKKQGRSLPEVVAAKPGARYDEVWGNLFQSRSDFVALVYQGV
jgi:glyoxylase-like metal-dependent hydrolase (beta-lactamase superfamily II)